MQREMHGRPGCVPRTLDVDRARLDARGRLEAVGTARRHGAGVEGAEVDLWPFCRSDSVIWRWVGQQQLAVLDVRVQEEARDRVVRSLIGMEGLGRNRDHPIRWPDAGAVDPGILGADLMAFGHA